MTQGHVGGPFSETWRVWIDWNQDGDFADANEFVVSLASSNSLNVNSTFTVPAGILTGITRMRVSMKYQGGAGFCDDGAGDGFEFGEVEDYCVNVMDSSGLGIVNSESLLFTLYPNPTPDNVTIEFASYSQKQVILMNAVGQQVDQFYVSKRTTIDLSSMASGVYFVKVIGNEGRTTIKRIVKQ